MWFKAKHCEVDFAECARYRFENQCLLRSPPDQVFAVLADCSSWPLWFDGMIHAEWVTSPPHGMGSVREMTLDGFSVRERFIVWKPAQRFAFTVIASSIPLVARMVEDIQLDPARGGQTHFRWFVHYTPRITGRAVHPLMRPLLRHRFKSACCGLADYLESTPRTKIGRPAVPEGDASLEGLLA